MMIDQPKLPTYSLTHFSAFSSGVARKPKIPRWMVRTRLASARCRRSNSFGPMKNVSGASPATRIR